MTKEKFLDLIGNWSNHRYFLWEALQATKHLKLPVLELGSGDGSTKYLREYCKDEGLEFISYDSNLDWAEKTGSIYVANWDLIAWRKEYEVVLVDMAPGEYRKIAISKLHHAKILICHDTEPAADHGYQMREPLSKFLYTKDFTSEGAWTTAASNFIDVTKWLQ